LEKTNLRIIGGEFRSRKIQFAVDPRTRPMKDRTREAVMNLLGGTLPESIAFDLFAGTGILAFEALSRGSSAAILFEILRNASQEILNNAKTLGLVENVVVIQNDVLRWTASMEKNLPMLRLPELPWVVFCCPPYALWEEAPDDMRMLLQRWVELAPVGSLFAIELEEKTPLDFLPKDLEWDVRTYRPARMAIGEKYPANSQGEPVSESESDLES
jgi:16S rRNA (guanine966-N2)-methyltransferase